jgi:hypothetical protein
MALDPLEKERLRRAMALRMAAFLDGAPNATCVSGHYYEEDRACDLCQRVHARDVLVLKNRSGRKSMVLAAECALEMMRYQVADIDDLPRWMDKLKELRADAERRREEAAAAREAQRKRYGKRVILRRKATDSSA